MFSRFHQYVPALILASMMVGCGDDSKNAPDNPTPSPQNPCGDGLLSDGEVCDGVLGVPASCSDIDPQKQWQTGGKPACNSTCTGITMGSCVEIHQTQPECGDGQKNGDEVCDGVLGVPATCAEFDSSRQWKDGGKPVCASNCMAVEIGSCIENTTKCGNRVREDGEVCDGMDGVPLTCSEFDDSIQWEEGGMPACSSNCDVVWQGSCVEFIPKPGPVCGDGKITGDEVCEGDMGVIPNCKVLGKNIEWKPGGLPACADDCKSIAAGTCEPIGVPYDITIMNWNVLFEWTEWGGREVLPRAQKLHDIVEKYPVKPAFISIVEASPEWHTDDVTALFNDLGYEWADNTPSPDTGRTLLSDIIYQKDQFDMLDHGLVKLLYDDSDPNGRGGQPVGADKAIAFYAVFQDKNNGEQFIQFSTHWDANNIWDAPNGETTPVKEIGWVSSHELNRVRGALDSAAKLAELREQYPKAHVFYGGDLNTIDLNILFNSASLQTLNVLLSTMTGSIVSIKDLPSLISTLNLFLSTSTAFANLPDDFVGSHKAFWDASGLMDARTEALSTGIITSEQDTWTTSEPGIPDVIAGMDLPIIIDYAFYSKDNMRLTGYKVMTNGDGVSSRDDYMFISDHFPVKTTYTYYKLAHE